MAKTETKTVKQPLSYTQSVAYAVELKAFHLSKVVAEFASSDTGQSKTLNKSIDKMKVDFTEYYQEQMVSGSLRFKLGNTVYVDRSGVLYKDVDSASGAGVAVGTVAYGTGIVELNSWQSDENKIDVQSLLTASDVPPMSHFTFRTANAPIRAGSLSVSVASLEQGEVVVRFNEDGVPDKFSGFADFEHGVVSLDLRTKTLIDDNNNPYKDKDWYKDSLVYDDGGKKYIDVPTWVDVSTLRYNAVSYKYIPLSKDVLGLSPTRLPSDGRVPIFRVGDVGIVSSTKLQVLEDSVAGKTYQLNHNRIAFAEVLDSKGKNVKAGYYTVDYDYGRITLTGEFVPADLTLPLQVKYRYQDMGLISEVSISGKVTFSKPLTHDYDTADSVVGSALIIGDMQARATNVFVQEAWNSVFQDVTTDNTINARYNDDIYPIVVTNIGAIQERWALVFTDNQSFRIVGETVGQIGTGTILKDCEPLNPVTNKPYFKILASGWGSGWANGNVLRFDTKASTYPVWVIRCVKQSEPTVLSDKFQIMLRGDVDRVV